MPGCSMWSLVPGSSAIPIMPFSPHQTPKHHPDADLLHTILHHTSYTLHTILCSSTANTEDFKQLQSGISVSYKQKPKWLNQVFCLFTMNRCVLLKMLHTHITFNAKQWLELQIWQHGRSQRHQKEMQKQQVSIIVMVSHFKNTDKDKG